MTKDEALKLALEALDCIYSPLHVREIEKVGNAMKVIKETLAQPEFVLNGIDCSCGRKWRVVNNTLTASEQPQRTWIGLTEEERDHFESLHLYAARGQVDAWIEGVPSFIDAIEAKLREKNGC